MTKSILIHVVHRLIIEAQAHYSEPRKDAMDKAFSETIPAQLKYLEKLLGSKTIFASKITAGDLAVAVIFNILLALEVPSNLCVSRLNSCASITKCRSSTSISS